MITVSELGQLFMSNVTIQGDGQAGRKDATQAIFLPDVSSKLFAEGICCLVCVLPLSVPKYAIFFCFACLLDESIWLLEVSQKKEV
jgi:hypothetical protein